MSGTARFQLRVSETFNATAMRGRVVQRLAQVAREKRDGLIALGQFPKQFTTTVNNVLGAAEETIKPAGSIVYRALTLGAAVSFALQFLAMRSPRRSGRFAGSFVVLAGNKGRVPAAAFEEQKIEGLRKVIVGSPEPYARKVDVQIAGKTTLRFSVPPGLYADAARAVTARFPSVRARRLGNVRELGQARRKAGRAVEYPGLMLEIA